jgi:hypothetical protein
MIGSCASRNVVRRRPHTIRFKVETPDASRQSITGSLPSIILTLLWVKYSFTNAFITF